ncbi:MAG: hypothetical protein ACOX2F_05995 [bacterium]
MKSRLLLTLLIAISLSINAFFFLKKESSSHQISEQEFFLYPQDYSPIDLEFSHDPIQPQYINFSIGGEKIVFVSLILKGSIIDSFGRKYDKKISDKLIKNIQEIAYFLNDYKVWFSERDSIMFFYTEKEEKIVYFRFRNSVKRTLSDIYLFETVEGKKYYSSDGSYLQPCITNGPFEGCPEVRFVSEGNTILPVFDVNKYQNIKFPFLAKIMGIDYSRSYGGEIETIYSNYATRAFFKGFGEINSRLKKNALYKKDAVIGKSGFVLQDGKSGIAYYLRKKENTPVSPFTFHHTEKKHLPEKYNTNFQIVKSFYARQLEFGLKFEKQYY